MNLLLALVLLTASPHQAHLNAALLRAASLGDAAKITMLVNQGADINTRTLLDQTPLELAVEYRREAAVRALLQHGANANVSSVVGTPMTWAAIDGDVAAMSLLLRHGAWADYHSQGLSSLTPLTTVLFASKFEKDQTSAAVSQMVIQVNPPTPQNQRLVKLIEEKEAEQAAHQYVGVQPEALKKRHTQNLQIVRLLLAHGADVNRKDGGGSTPLMVASLAGDADAAILLVEHGAIVNAKDQFGMTALYEASQTDAQSGNTDLVKFLLDQGADPNIQSKGGRTALSQAVEGQNVETIKLLLAHGANPNLVPLTIGPNRNLSPQPGETIFARAKEYGNPEIIKLLENAGAK